MNYITVLRQYTIPLITKFMFYNHICKNAKPQYELLFKKYNFYLILKFPNIIYSDQTQKRGNKNLANRKLINIFEKIKDLIK